MTVDPTAIRGITWDLTELVKITDGDTVHGHLSRTGPYDELSDYVITTSREVIPSGLVLRLVWVNCPDLPFKDAKAAATQDTRDWFAQYLSKGLKVTTWYGGGFNRYLADIFHVDPDGTRHSLSEWLLTEANNGKGWPPFVG